MTCRKSALLIVSLILVTAFGAPSTVLVMAQDDATADLEGDKIQAVFRISKQFLDDVTDETIVADVPLCARVVGFQCTGVIHGEGNVTVDLLQDHAAKEGKPAVFAIDSRGNGSVCVKGVRGPIVAVGPAWGPFSSRTLVEFDGKEYKYLSTVPRVGIDAKLSRVTGRRDRPIGRLIGRGIKPMGEHLISRAKAEAIPIAKRYLCEFIRQTADQIIEQLNEQTPVESSINRLFPKTGDWVLRMSSDDDFIQAAYGPPDAELAALPDAKEEVDGVRIEVWLRSTSEEAQLLENLNRSPLAKQLVGRYLDSTLPELSAVADDHSIDAIGDWVLIRIIKNESE